MRFASLSEIAEALGEEYLGESLEVAGYHINSKTVEEGGLFFALPGKKRDGHEFLAEVQKRGGSFAIVQRAYKGPDFGLVLIRVESVKEALCSLARYFMKRHRAQIIGVSGSVGKTTTKEFIATLLQEKFKVGKTPSSQNSQLTFPLTLLNLKGDEEVLVLELGISEPGGMKSLLKIVEPDLAVLTKVGHAHAENFAEGMRGIAKEKLDLFSGSRTQLCLFDHEMHHQFEDLLEQIEKKKMSFSLQDRSADYFLSESYFLDEKGIRSYQFDPPYKQTHFLHDFLAAVSVARQMKLDWDEINRRVPFLELPKMRFEMLQKEGVVFINDAYNANPESMKAALSHFPQGKEEGKKIAVLGMMAELGSDHERFHREIGLFAQKYVDHLFVFGKEAFAMYEAFQEAKKPTEKYENLAALAKRLKSLVREGDVVLIKASRSVELEKLMELV